jgi:hypothetical protein
LDKHDIEEKDYSWNIVVLNHDDVTWDCPKREELGKRKRIF